MDVRTFNRSQVSRRGTCLLMGVLACLCAGPTRLCAQSEAIEVRAVSWRDLAPNIAGDQKRVWLYPVKIVKDKQWIPAAAFVGATAALIAFDPIEGRYFRNTNTFSRFNKVFSGEATELGTVLVPISLYGFGVLREDPEMRSTAMLAGEAAVDSEIFATILKMADRRAAPMDYPRGTNLTDTWFNSPGSGLRTNGSFPSGHTIAAFSVATVIARRYGHHRWVPYTAYGLAAVVGFSRLSLSAHFLSDVVAGGVFGYSISRFAVLHE